MTSLTALARQVDALSGLPTGLRRSTARSINDELVALVAEGNVSEGTIRDLAVRTLRAVRPSVGRQPAADAATALAGLAQWCADGPGPGAPQIGGRATIAFGEDRLEWVDNYAASRNMTRAAAIRELLDKGLAG